MCGQKSQLYCSSFVSVSAESDPSVRYSLCTMSRNTSKLEKDRTGFKKSWRKLSFLALSRNMQDQEILKVFHQKMFSGQTHKRAKPFGMCLNISLTKSFMFQNFYFFFVYLFNKFYFYVNFYFCILHLQTFKAFFIYLFDLLHPHLPAIWIQLFKPFVWPYRQREGAV